MRLLLPTPVIGRSLISLSLILGAAAGCDAKSFGYPGQPMPEFFPLDGDRSWSYRQCGPDDAACVPSEPRELHVVKSSTRSVGETQVASLRYGLFDPEQAEEPDVAQFTIEWSSDTSDGILIWSASTADGTVLTYEDDPVVVAEREMNTGDAVSTGGVTSTFIGMESCTTNWVPDTAWECAHLEITGADEPFVGDWWMATTNGTAIFQPAGAAEPWVLSESIWVPAG